MVDIDIKLALSRLKDFQGKLVNLNLSQKHETNRSQLPNVLCFQRCTDTISIKSTRGLALTWLWENQTSDAGVLLFKTQISLRIRLLLNLEPDIFCESVVIVDDSYFHVKILRKVVHE